MEDNGEVAERGTVDEFNHNLWRCKDCIVVHHFGVISMQCHESVVRFGKDGNMSSAASIISSGFVSSCWFRVGNPERAYGEIQQLRTPCAMCGSLKYSKRSFKRSK